MGKRPQDGVEDIIEFLADIVSQEPQEKLVPAPFAFWLGQQGYQLELSRMALS